jgi:hypothetical protein
MNSCAPSPNYVDAPKIVPELPTLVTDEAKRGLTKLPAPTKDAKAKSAKQAQKLITTLTESEAAKQWALLAAIERYNAMREQLKATP